MRLCIPVTEANGLQSEVSDHFGRAPHHIVVDLESQAVETLVKTSDCSADSGGHCLPVDLLRENQVEVVACKGIGRGAVARLMASKIELYATRAQTVAEVIDEFRQKRLVPLSDEHVCEGHHHHH